MQKLHLRQAPERRLAMTFALRQSLEVLQMPQQELASWLQTEIERNPLFEFHPRKSIASSRPSLDPELHVASRSSLYDSLLKQVRDSFCHQVERHIATILLEHLDERGFIDTSLQEIAAGLDQPVEELERILQILQTFDPPGICARNLQESLLLQLKRQGKERTAVYRLVEKSFDDLLHGRFASLKKKAGADPLSEAVKILARLSFRPSESAKEDPVSNAWPDLKFSKNGSSWTVETDESELPRLQLRPDYLALNPALPEEKEAIRSFKASAKWILRSLSRRRKLLIEIGKILVRKQAAYLDQSGPLKPLTLKELAEQFPEPFKVHESTLSRALAGKYAETPCGLIPLRSLLSASPESETAKQLLEKLLKNENKQSPLTDDQLAASLKENGYPIARRTVAKYRRQLKIGAASQRKNLG